MAIAPPPFPGSCLCGVVRYEARAEIRAASFCHCSMCQKAHGAAFGPYGSVPLGAFVVVAGAQHMQRFASSPGVTRTFCNQCGSPLTWRRETGEWAEWISFSLGTLDVPFIPAKRRDLHLASAPSWHLRPFE